MSEVRELNGQTNHIGQHEETNGHHDALDSHDHHKAIEPISKSAIPSITTENNDEDDAKAEEALNQLSAEIIDDILPPSDAVTNGQHSEVTHENSTVVESTENHAQTPNQPLVEEVSQAEETHYAETDSHAKLPEVHLQNESTDNQAGGDAEVSKPSQVTDDTISQPAESMIVECGSESELGKAAETPAVTEEAASAEAPAVEGQDVTQHQAESQLEVEAHNESSEENPVVTISDDQPEAQNPTNTEHNQEAPVAADIAHQSVEQEHVETKPNAADTIPVSAHELQQHEEVQSEAHNDNMPEAQEDVEHSPAVVPAVEAVIEEPVAEVVERVPPSLSPPLSHHSVHDEPLVRDEPEPLKDHLLNPHHVEEVKEPEPPMESTEKVEVHEVSPVTSEPPEVPQQSAEVPAQEPETLNEPIVTLTEETKAVSAPSPPEADPAPTIVAEQKETIVTVTKQETPVSASAKTQVTEPQATSSASVAESTNAVSASAENQQNTSGSSNKTSTLPRRYFEAARKRCTII
ncbi:hypothetical protein Ddc_06954 [Ditylenchus destructor]|nr:hypothetical protein Ddc_06954 [Ditylenchus destructor]